MADPRDRPRRPSSQSGGKPPSLDMMERRALLDEALIGLRSIKDAKLPVRALERHLAASLRALYGALVAAADAERFKEGTSSALNRALAALETLESLGSKDAAAQRVTRRLREATRDWREAAGRTLLNPPSLPQPAPGEWPRALGAVPSLLTVERGPLPPAIVLPLEDAPELEHEEEPPPSALASLSLEELLARATQAGTALEAPLKEEKAPAREGKANKPPVTLEDAEREHLGVQLTREEVEFSRARAFFEELATMSQMRRPDAGELWSELRSVEERLLARVDGILACGEGVLFELVKLLDDRPVPDPELTWAALFVPGCLAGDDALHQVARVVRSVGLEEPEVFEAACDALAFVPHPGLNALLRGWMAGKEPLPRLLAIRVLGRRGQLTSEQALGFAWEEEPRLCLEGARALPRVRGELDLNATARLLRHEQEAVVASAIEALWLRRSPAGFNQARALVGKGQHAFADAALWLAIGAGADVHDDFEAALARGTPSATLLEAVGWYGDPRFVDPLLALLEAGKVAAVGALQRLTGASLTDDVPDPEYERGQEPFMRAFSPPDAELELTADPKVWRAWWEKHRDRAVLTKRYRWGHLWSAEDNLWELEHAPASPRERRLAFHELVARTGAAHPFDPEDFVARQEEAIARWREAPELRRAVSGSWALSFSG